METSPDPAPVWTSGTGKTRLLIFIVAYNAQTTIEKVLRRIPASLTETYAVEVLVIDDSSRDETFVAAETSMRRGPLPFPVHILRNPINQGYGGMFNCGKRGTARRGVGQQCDGACGSRRIGPAPAARLHLDIDRRVENAAAAAALATGPRRA